jgi:hypothetical protein
MSELQGSPPRAELPARSRRWVFPLAALALAAIIAVFVGLRPGAGSAAGGSRASETDLQKRVREATEERVRAQARIEALTLEADRTPPKTGEKLRRLLQELESIRDLLVRRRSDLDEILKKAPEAVPSIPAPDIAAVIDERNAVETVFGSVGNEIYRWKSLLPVLDPPKREIIFDVRKYHPWGTARLGWWVRYETKIRKGKEESVRFEDRALRTSSGEAAVVAIFEGSAPPREERIAFADIKYRLVGEETLTVGETSIRCAVVEFTRDGRTNREWIALEGRGEGWWVVKAEGEVRLRPLRVGQGIFETGGGRFPAMILESEVEDAQGKASVLEWRSASFPGHLVRREEKRGDTVTLLDAVRLGRDLENRPPFPTLPPK